MKPEFEGAVTTSFLRSGRVLCHVSNCAAVIAAGGVLLSHLAGQRLLFGVSILCWPVASYFGVRVAIDESLFRELAGKPAEGWRTLDEMLRVNSERTLAERCRGALKLWRRLIVMVVVQVAILGAGLAAW